MKEVVVTAFSSLKHKKIDSQKVKTCDKPAVQVTTRCVLQTELENICFPFFVTVKKIQIRGHYSSTCAQKAVLLDCPVSLKGDPMRRIQGAGP